MPSVKICTTCHAEKAVSAFHRSSRATGARPSRGGMGVSAKCKVCTSVAREPMAIPRQLARAAIAARGEKPCGSCQMVKALSEFHKSKASGDGHAFRCKECVKKICAEWRAKHPNAHKDWYRQNKPHKLAYWKLYREANKERLAGTYAEWAKANPEKINALVAKRLAQKRRALPQWANTFFMREAYALAKLRERVVGGKWHVDHIVPLQSEIVCGLHVETNIRVIPAFDNQSKSNRHWPDMPC